MKPNKLIADLQKQFRPYSKDEGIEINEEYQALGERVHAFLQLHADEVKEASKVGSHEIIKSFRYTRPAPPEIVAIVQQTNPDMPADTILLDIIISAWYSSVKNKISPGSVVELVTRIITASPNSQGGYNYEDGSELFHRVETTGEIVDTTCMADNVFDDIDNTYPPEFIHPATTQENIEGIRAGLESLEDLLASENIRT